jgi:glycine/D-amino acid oxidase-like deaminating enzyme
MILHDCDIVIIGAGIVGIATAYYLKRINPTASVLLLDSDQPMSLTSAQSGENYRNWWPHPVMTAFTDHSIDLMEAFEADGVSHINMSRRGYALSSRSDDVSTLLEELTQGYADLEGSAIRIHDSQSHASYRKPISASWQDAPTGVDVLHNQTLIRATFPSYDHGIKTVVHIRRAGSISAQQMGEHMLKEYKQKNGQRLKMEVGSIESADGFLVRDKQDKMAVKAQQLVNAAGPYINDIANMLGTSLPVTNTLQQKIAFEDTAKCIPRKMPFSIDLDPQTIDWTDEETALLAESDEHAWLTKEMPGAIHCRPDGGDAGSWVKLGWAYNNTNAQAEREPSMQDAFPEIVLRGAARLNPALKHYYGQLPRAMRHYGGFYTLTDENWPLIGPMDVDGSYVVGAMSGFGTMAACAAGDLCARVVSGSQLPHYAHALSLKRYNDTDLLAEIRSLSQRGIL